MKQFGLILTWLIFSVSSACAQSDVKWPAGFQQRTHVADSGDQPYFVFVPDGEPPSGGWPVILFLHGAGERGSDNIAQIAVGLGTALEKQQRPFVAVFPQCRERGQPYRTGWLSSTKDAQRALNILAAVEQSETINSSQRILCGWSMGGYGAWSIAAAKPEMWSAVLAISGGAIEPVDFSALAKAKVPFWAIHGAEDGIVPATETKDACRALRGRSGLVEETIVNNAGHDVWRYVFAEDATFKWLLDPKHHAVPEISTTITPLPRKADFYVKNFSHKVVVPDALGVRIGNDALNELADEFPAKMDVPLQGTLPDIHRSLGQGAESVELQLEKLSWSCQLSKCDLRAISGGRFEARFYFAPIELKIGSGHLENESIEASCSNARIVIGHRRPVTLRVEVRPKMENGRLRLAPLRKSFSIPDDNWFVESPERMHIERGELKAEHLKIGIVGGLYLQKDAITAQILEAVPTFLKTAESSLQSLPAPALTRVIWPFPVGGPEIVVAPSAVKTSRTGVSVVLDANVVKYGTRQQDLRDVHEHCRLTIENLSKTSQAEVLACLDLTNACSQIQQDRAWVNVLDIPSPAKNSHPSGDSFSSLVSKDFVESAFGHDHSLQAILRVLKPMSVKAQGSHQLRFCVSEAALDFSTSGGMTTTQACRIVFSLEHDVQFELQSSGDVRVTWSDQPNIELLEVRPLGDAQVLEVNSELVIEKLRECWQAWTQAQNRSFQSPKLPATEMGLKNLQIESNAIRLNFESPGS